MLGRGRALDTAVLFSRKTYLQRIQAAGDFDMLFYGKGSQFRRFNITDDYGTNTTNNGEHTSNLDIIAFDGTTSYVDLLSLFTTIPPEMTFSMLVRLDNWESGVIETLYNFIVASDRYLLQKRETNVLRLYQQQATVFSFDDYDITGFSGFYLITATYTSNLAYLYVGNTQVITLTPAASPTGTLTRALIGSDATTPTQGLNGDIVWFAINSTTAISESAVESLFNVAGT